MAKVLFRVDAGPQVGLGHLQRCLSLATAMSSLGSQSLFVANNNPTLGDRVARFGFQSIPLLSDESWGSTDLDQTVETAASNGCDVIVVDSDYEGRSYLGRLRGMSLSCKYSRNRTLGNRRPTRPRACIRRTER